MRRITQDIKPLILPNKDKFLSDLSNIEQSWTGRLDVLNLCNTFIRESEQLLVNAIELFELGYFDCAYYSLRSAVDLSTTIVFLSDMPDDEREKYTDLWKKSQDFPLKNKMLKLLSEKGNTFADMRNKMPDFFNNAKILSEQLNKYVHKQGLKHFYVVRNNAFNLESSETFISNFEYHLKKCIGIVAVMRLAIDPFPIILTDEEIIYRCSDTMTEPYHNDFISEYIGEKTLFDYQKTIVYQDYYNHFIQEERKSQSVFNVVKYKFIDYQTMDELMKQLHLMSMHDIIAVLIAYSCNKTVNIYAIGGLLMYFTEKETNRKTMSWSTADFDRFEKTENKLNQPYYEAYISVFTFNEESYFIEHNETISSEDYMKITVLVSMALKRMLGEQIEK